MKKLIPFLVVIAIAVFGCLSEDHSGGDQDTSDTLTNDTAQVDSTVLSQIDSLADSL